ncbi:MAG: ABC transporter ATP-binding protein [Chloroflexi bacterium]|nr:ABC transporter ATP-binding protein [Chloroflexota bacterium]
MPTFDQARTDAEPLLSVRDLVVEYHTQRGLVRAADHVSFDLHRNEVFGLAGESGCGKSTVAHAITRILKPPAHIAGGQVLFDEVDVLKLNDDQLRDIRWRRISIVFQSAMNALSPVLTVGTQIADALQAHENGTAQMTRRQVLDRARELLDLVGIDPDRVNSYPHQLSGGMRQRVVIAIALALNPELIVMDEPTTALDVVVQKQIMDQIRELRNQFGFSILFISHDLSLMVEFSDRVGIMYAGELVEVAPSQAIFNDPQHPYTVRLMNSFPTLSGPRVELFGIPGSPPDLITPPPGCRFHPRCDVALAGRCQTERPGLQPIGARHMAACHLLDDKIVNKEDAS